MKRLGLSSVTASATLAVALTLVLPSCDQGKKPGATSGAQTDQETALLASLPGGNLVLFGGNYAAMQKHMHSSPLFKLLGTLDTSGAPGTSKWMNCFADIKDVAMLGGVTLDDKRVSMRFVMKGIDLQTLEGCAKRADYKATIDADGKFMALEMPNPLGVMRAGYLVLPDGALYTRQTMPFPEPTLHPVDRAMLEADFATVKTKSAATDTVLVSRMASLDRSKAVWFVATAAGTPIADKVGTAYGTFDIANGLSLDLHVQVLDAAIAKQISDGVPQMKTQTAQLGPELAAIVERLKLTRDGEWIHMSLAVDNAQLQAAIDKLAPMMGQLPR